MEGLSKQEIQVIADLEFRKKYYFTSEDIRNHFKNKKQVVNTIYNLRKKGRIVALNKNKYFLVPIRAMSGKWTEHPFIIVDEACNGEDYMIGGWSAANYWQLTDQIPMQHDIYTTKGQRSLKVLNTKIVFHRTTEKRLKNAITRKIGEHVFRIQNKEETKEWLKSRS